MKTLITNIALVAIGLAALAAMEIVRLYRQQLICPSYTWNEKSTMKMPRLLATYQ
jgi:hypothetical protein